MTTADARHSNKMLTAAEYEENHDEESISHNGGASVNCYRLYGGMSGRGTSVPRNRVR